MLWSQRSFQNSRSLATSATHPWPVHSRDRQAFLPIGVMLSLHGHVFSRPLRALPSSPRNTFLAGFLLTRIIRATTGHAGLFFKFVRRHGNVRDCHLGKMMKKKKFVPEKGTV